MFENATLQDLLDVVEPLLASTDKFKQAAAAEILTGLLRGMLYLLQLIFARTEVPQDPNIGHNIVLLPFGVGWRLASTTSSLKLDQILWSTGIRSFK